MNKLVQAIILGTMCLILAIGISVQIRTVNNSGSTINSNQKLNNLKDQVLRMKERYEESYARLEATQNELENKRKNIANNDEELKSLEEELNKNNILLGQTEVTGPGVIITITDATINQNTINPLLDPYNLVVHDVDILEIVNELKNAGAEAIDVNGQRIVNNTEISCDGNVITVNGEKVASPFVISAIGLPERFNTLKRPYGYLYYMEEATIKVDFNNKVDKITIPKYTGVTKFKYAKTIN